MSSSLKLALSSAACAIALTAMSTAASTPALALAKCMTGERKAPYTIGWANIYSIPTWMKQTQGPSRTCSTSSRSRA
ncbi:MAG: hypothetical protein R3C69_17760 [Geminicoccaceae bacterium]